MREPLIDNFVMEQFDPGEQKYLRVKFSDPSFQRFLMLQRDAAQKRIALLDPAKAKTPDEFFQSAKEMHLALAFWNEFLTYMEAWKQLAGAPDN